MTMTASEMGKQGYQARLKKYGKKGLAEHAELMRNARLQKKLNKIKAKNKVGLST